MTIPETLERITEWTPAFDKRHPDPNKNYGIHGVECRWILKGCKGAIQFLIYTNWHLPHVASELAAKRNSARDILLSGPMAADIGYHSPVAQYEGQLPISTKPCEYIGGRPCYYDGSGLAAETLLQTLIEKGDGAVWSAMEERYHELLTEAPSTEVVSA